MIDFLQTISCFVASFVAEMSRAIHQLRDACIYYFWRGSKNSVDSAHAHSQAGSGYGYQGKLNSVLKTEFPQLQGKVYADHAGATLYTKSQIEALKQDLESHLFGNPHSQHGWSGNVGSAAAVAEARQVTLEMCNAPLGEYECVFTAGATGALKLVGEAFPWQDGSQFVYTQDNHNSVLGIRELALDHDATASCVDITSGKGQEVKFCAVSSPMQRASTHHCKLSCEQTHELQPRQGPSLAQSSSLPPDAQLPASSEQAGSPSSSSSGAQCSRGRDRAAAAHRGPCLFAFPLESNFSGERYAPAVVNQIQTQGLSVRDHKEQEEEDARRQEEEAQGPGQPHSGMQRVSTHDQQHDHKQQRGEAEVQRAVQGLTREEEHWQRQPAAAEEAAEGLSGQQGCNEEARGLLSRPRQSESARWHVLIDAAKACATAPPDLTKHPADFVSATTEPPLQALSYYKIFGYPTGLGALLVHKRAVPLLMKRKRYFGGGTVAVSVAEEDFFRRRKGAAGLEDGTAHYLGIAAVSHGFRQLASLGGFPAVARHTRAVTRLFVTHLAEMRHANGTPFCLIYGAHSLWSDQPFPGSPGAVGQGPVVTFNLLRPDRSYVGYREVEKLAGLHSIFLRTGCFCNPGACARHLGLTASQLKQNYEAGHVCWDDNDIIDDRPTGAVRVSFGWMSSEEDVQAIITFLKTCFLDTAGRQEPSGQNYLGQNPTFALTTSVKGKPTGQGPIGHNPSGHNLSGHHPGVQDPSFSLNAHCSTVATSAADSNHLSSVHSTARSNPVNSQGQGHHDHQRSATPQQRHSQQTQSRSQAVQGSTVHDRAPIQSAEPQISHTVSNTHAQSEAEPRPSAKEVAVQHSKRCAWLRQLPWVNCGDEVSAWPASSDESQRLTPPFPTPPGAQPGGQSGGLPPDASAPSCRQQAHSAHSPSESALESASQSVPHSDFQHDSASHSVPSSLHCPTIVAQHGSESQPRCSQGSLEGIWVYPIKSCGGIRVSEWPLGPNGLLLDREWALVGDDGHVLTQKGLPKLALVQPRVDLWQGFIQITSPTMSTHLLVHMPLMGSETSPAVQDQPGAMHVRVCADNVCSLQEVVSADSQEEVCNWFQQALGVRCCLVRQSPGSRTPITPLQPGRQKDQDPTGHIGFANEGQFLLMNSASLADMIARINAQANSRKKRTVSSVGDLSRFRPNLLVGGSGVAAYAEDDWQKVCIGTHELFTAGPCARCEMICMDQTTGVRAGPEPLLTLASYRRQKGRVFLGILLGRNCC